MHKLGSCLHLLSSFYLKAVSSTISVWERRKRKRESLGQEEGVGYTSIVNCIYSKLCILSRCASDEP